MDEEYVILYDAYCKVVHEAYETESDFYKDTPKTKELGDKVKEAYKKFDEARNEYLKKEKT